MTATTRARVRLPMVVGSMALLWVAPVCAQRLATSFDELRGLVEPGDTIYVTDTGGVTIKGKVAALSAASLELRVRRDATAPPLRVSERDVNNIVIEQFDSLWNGMLTGFVVGAAAGLLIELAGRSEYERFSGTGALGLGTISLLTGLLIDAFNKERNTIYVHAPGPQSSRVHVRPLLTKSGAGVQMRVGFLKRRAR